VLVEVKTLKVENEGYKRRISLDRIYVNSNNIVSIVDYEGASNFLLRENSQYSGESFSLIKLNEGGHVRDLIVFGSAEQLYSSLSGNATGKRLLND
tara:strand:+ start:145 stop:432 length:288 start_codon:yes stop_codon:yes gene_type:complete